MSRRMPRTNQRRLSPGGLIRGARICSQSVAYTCKALLSNVSRYVLCATGVGGIGGGAGSFTAGAPVGGGGAAAGDDPYANIALDLTKVKAAPVAAKPFEAKTEEEKQ